MALVELKGVTRRFGAPFDSGSAGPEVLRGVDLVIERGEAVAIVGPSGAGKSTLLNIIGGLDQPTTGSARLDGRDLATLDAKELAGVRNAEIGFVFQSHHLLPQLSALENVLVPTLVSAVRDGAEARALALLDRVGLAQRVQHRPGQLSGGECQRVAVVRALINSPAVLLADEPTGSLDSEAADALGSLLLELNGEEGVALVVVTHSDSLAARMDRIVRIKDGLLESPVGA